MSENPYPHELIDSMLSGGKARELWPHTPERDEDTGGEWIYMALLGLGLREHEMTFLNAISAGHTIADASRQVSRDPRWGYRFLKRLRKKLGTQRPQ